MVKGYLVPLLLALILLKAEERGMVELLLLLMMMIMAIALSDGDEGCSSRSGSHVLSSDMYGEAMRKRKGKGSRKL